MYQVYRKWTTAKKQEYNGFRYDSGFEAKYAQDLDILIKAKAIKGYDKQVNLDLIVNGYIVCQYRIDFIIYHLDGTKEYIECKGYPTDVWKLKWKLFESLYSGLPDVKLTIVQQGKFKSPRLRRVKFSAM